MSAKYRASPRKEHLRLCQNLVAYQQLQTILRHKVHPPAENRGQFSSHSRQRQKTHSRLGLKLHQHIHIAVMSEILPKHGTEQRQPPDIMLPTERGNLLLVGLLWEVVRSRLSPVVIELPAYTPQEIEAILTDRARRALAPDSWTPAVLKRIATAANGDARVAIQILRQAAASAEMSGNTKLTTCLVERCLRPWRLVRQEARLAGLSEHEKILFEQVKQHGPLGASELARRYVACCQGRNIRPMARRTFTKYLGQLSAAGLLETSGQIPGPGGRIVRASTANP